MSLSTVWSIIQAIPKIIGFVKDIMKMIEKAKRDKQDRDRAKATEKLQDAKKESEVKDAAKDFLDSLQ
jgi:transcription antitermination factor NusG